MALRLALVFAGVSGAAALSSPVLRSNPLALAQVQANDGNVDMSNTDSMKLWYFSNAVVSCKGQIYEKNSSGGWSTAHVEYDGCGHSRGSCKQEKWSQGPYLTGPPSCTGPKNEDMREECGLPTVPRIVVITQPQWGAYYHFLVDSLPRIIWVREQRPELLTDPSTFFHVGLTNENGQSWGRMVGIDTHLDAAPPSVGSPVSLSRKKKRNFGLEKAQAIQLSDEEWTAKKAGSRNRLLGGWWSAKQVVWPPSNGCVMGQNHAQPHAIEGMRSLAQQAAMKVHPAVSNGQPAPMALLVQRDVATTFGRALLNHDELLKALQETLVGWTVEVYPDPAPDAFMTCNMFSRASLVIGPHGAGFSNLMCTSADVPLVEIQQKPHAHDFQLLSGALGMTYFGVPTEMTHGAPHKVDIPSVIKVVKEAVAKRAALA